MGLTTDVLVIFLICKLCTASPINNGEVDVVSDINTILDAIANLTKNLKSVEETGNKALQQIKSNNKLLKGDFDLTVSQAQSFAVRLQIYEETRGRDISDCVDDFKLGLEQLSIDLTEYAKDCYNEAKDNVDDLIKEINMPNSTDIVDEVEEMFKNCDNIFCKQTTGEYGLLRVCAASPIHDGEVDAVSDINTILEAIANFTKSLKSSEEIGNEILQQIRSDQTLFIGNLDLAVAQAHRLAFRLQIFAESMGRDISHCVNKLNSDLEDLSIDFTTYAEECYENAEDYVHDMIQEFDMPSSTYLVDELEAMFRYCDNIIFCKQTTGEYGLLRVTEYRLVVERYYLEARAKAKYINNVTSGCFIPHYDEAIDEGHKTAENFKKCANSGFLPIIKQ